MIFQRYISLCKSNWKYSGIQVLTSQKINGEYVRVILSNDSDGSHTLIFDNHRRRRETQVESVGQVIEELRGLRNWLLFD
jgi:hypothetical protein